MATLDYTQLVFASEVRKLAVKMYREEREAMLSSQFITPDKVNAWDAAHPFQEFVDIALNEILQVAAIIKTQADQV